MQNAKLYFLFFAIALASCKEQNASILKTAINEGKSDKSFIEGAITTGSISNDTILYYKFDLLTNSALFKENPSLNIGIYYSNLTEGNAHVINLAFREVKNKEKWESLHLVDSSNRITYTTIKKQNHNKGTEMSFNFSDDKYLNPTTSTFFTSEEKMQTFLRLFKDEIDKATNNIDTIRYSSVSHVDGHFKDITMTVTFR